MDDYAIYGDKVVLLSKQLRSSSLSSSNIPYLIRDVIEGDMWRVFNHPSAGQLIDNHTKSFAQFVKTPPPDGLGSEVKIIENVLIACTKSDNARDSKVAQEAITAFSQALTGKIGTNQYIEGRDNITTLSERGTSKSYAHRKLCKDAPEIYQRVINGEISAHAGMVEAGYRKKQITFTHDVDSAVKMLRNKFTPAELEKIRDKLTPQAK
jgi:hypothetical protein